jgi:hypothetical protein
LGIAGPYNPAFATHRIILQHRMWAAGGNCGSGKAAVRYRISGWVVGVGEDVFLGRGEVGSKLSKQTHPGNSSTTTCRLTSPGNGQ